METLLLVWLTLVASGTGERDQRSGGVVSPVWELAQAWVWVVAGLLVVVPQELTSVQTWVWDWELFVQVDQALQVKQAQDSVQVGYGGVTTPVGILFQI